MPTETDDLPKSSLDPVSNHGISDFFRNGKADTRPIFSIFEDGYVKTMIPTTPSSSVDFNKIAIISQSVCFFHKYLRYNKAT